MNFKKKSKNGLLQLIIFVISVAFYSFVFDAGKYFFGKKRRRTDTDD